MATTITQIKEALRSILQGAGQDVTVAFDYAAPPEASRAIIIDAISINYEHQLDLGAYRTLSADLNVYAKTAADLDALIDAISSQDSSDTPAVRYLEINNITINGDDPDVKSARISVSARIDEL